MNVGRTDELYESSFENVEQFSQKYESDDLFYLHIYCKYLINALKIIRKRYNENYLKLLELNHELGEITNKTGEKNPYAFNRPEDRALHDDFLRLQDQFRLDHESYIIYARILMDKIAWIAYLIIKDNNFPPHSLNDQKKWLSKHNISGNYDRSYGDLVRNRTGWFTLNLRGDRDEFIIHGSPRVPSFSISRERGIRINLTDKIFGSMQQSDSDALIAIKTKHAKRNLDLKDISNVWEILRFILNHDLELDNKEINNIIQIKKRIGTILTDVEFIERKLSEFIGEFNKIFVP